MLLMAIRGQRGVALPSKVNLSHWKGYGMRLEEEPRPLRDSLVVAVRTDPGSASPAPAL